MSPVILARLGFFRAILWSVWAILCIGCEERAPFVPTRDSGTIQFDGGARPLPSDGGSERRSDTSPRLPPADLEVSLPYDGPEVRLPLEISANLGTLDVFLSIDTTGSFGGEIDALQRDLNGSIVPALAARVPNVAIGVGRFEDFPVGPFGSPGDHPFRLVAPITTDLTRIGGAVASLDDPLGIGGDSPESGAEALWQIATGTGYVHRGTTFIAPYRAESATGGDQSGGVGFRDGALRVVVHVTDAVTHSPIDYEPTFPGTHSLSEAADALQAMGVRAIGVASGPAPRAELEQLAMRTGAVAPPETDGCHTGIRGEVRAPVDGVCPLVFDVAPDGTGLPLAIVDSISDLLDTVYWEEVYGVAPDDSLGFVRAIAATEARVSGSGTPPIRVDRRPMDGVDDTFLEVRPGTSVDFEVVLRNETVPPADYDQFFHIEVRILGDDLVLVTKTVRVIVPRGRIVR
jgi:hypothetical protein